MNAYLQASFHLDHCVTEIFFSLTQFDTHSPQRACVQQLAKDLKAYCFNHLL